MPLRAGLLACETRNGSRIQRYTIEPVHAIASPLAHFISFLYRVDSPRQTCRERVFDRDQRNSQHKSIKSFPKPVDRHFTIEKVIKRRKKGDMGGQRFYVVHEKQHASVFPDATRLNRKEQSRRPNTNLKYELAWKVVQNVRVWVVFGGLSTLALTLVLPLTFIFDPAHYSRSRPGTLFLLPYPPSLPAEGHHCARKTGVFCGGTSGHHTVGVVRWTGYLGVLRESPFLFVIVFFFRLAW